MGDAPARSSASMSPFRVLFVCIGNVCRSPLGERLLASKLSNEDFELSGAGVAAMVGSPLAPASAAHLDSYGGSVDRFAGRQLVPAMVNQSDLVLTATRGRVQ